MKIALCSTYVPFVRGGYRNIVDWLRSMLEREGHEVESIYLPEVDAPELLISQMAAFRWIDLDAADRVICFRPQAHLISHPHKILWFIHHIRGFYDLWNSDYGYPDTPQNRRIKQALTQADTNALHEAKSIFTNSKVVSERLMKFNGVTSEVLYPPLFDADRFYNHQQNDDLVCISRLEHHKRQHLLIEAMRFTKTPVRLRLCGSSGASEYPEYLRKLIAEYDLSQRVTLDERWIAEDEKIKLLSDCLAAVYVPVDEDSYGYPSVEASHAKKSILTTSDAGGVLELVIDGYNGLVAEPSAGAVAEAMDRLFRDRRAAEQMGKNSYARLSELKISWANVIDRLLA
jgi:glycosyltransferase involved in cell wall biosynthesis